MHVAIISVFVFVILLTGQSHQSIVVKEDAHWTYHRSDVHVDTEVILVSLIQSWLLQILLHYILILRSLYLPLLYLLLFLLVRLIRVGLHYFQTSFNFDVFLHVFSVLLVLFV